MRGTERRRRKIEKRGKERREGGKKRAFRRGKKRETLANGMRK